MKNDDNSDLNPTNKLVKVFDKISARAAIIVIIFLIIIHFVLALLPSGSTANFSKTDIMYNNAIAFLQQSIVTIWPVFLLFVLSYWLLRELNRLRRQREKNEFSESTAHMVVSLLGTAPVADKFFARRTPESSFVEHAEQELLLVQETGSLLFEQCKSSLVNLLSKKGSIRMIVVDPAPESASLLAYRNANMDREAIRRRAIQLIAHLEDLLHLAPQHHDSIEVRFCPYPVCSTLVIVDKDHPRTERACALVRLAGFRMPFDDKLDFQLSLDRSPSTYSHYVKEFENLWKASSKILFLTGEPQCGKTTLLSRLKEELADISSIYFCISKACTDRNGVRTGFEAVTSHHPTPRQFATRDASGEYKVDLAVIDAIAAEITISAQKCRLLIIDEIGPIQLKSEAFVRSIESLLNRSDVSVVASVAVDASKHPLLRKLRSHYRTHYFHLNKQQNDQSILEHLRHEVESLLRRPAFYKQYEQGNKKVRRS